MYSKKTFQKALVAPLILTALLATSCVARALGDEWPPPRAYVEHVPDGTPTDDSQADQAETASTPPTTTPIEVAYAPTIAEQQWYIDVILYEEWVRAAEYAQAQADAAAAERERAAEGERNRREQHATTQSTPGRCGGDLPPCYVMMRESGGNITAQNPTSTASGKWQALDSTWNNFGGYPKARLAPESVQDDFARRLWDGGRGCSHWSACG